VKLPSWLATPKGDPAGTGMTITEHLAELRVRIIRVLLAVVLATVVVLSFYDWVLDLMLQPYRNLCDRKGPDFCQADLFALGPLEGFSARVRISLWGGLALALPVILWQIWRFVVPALHAREKRYAIPFIFSTVALFAVGAFLAYWTLDKALEFLISWSGTDVRQAFQISRYASLVVLMVVAFGIGFEIPVLLVFLQLVGVVTSRQLIKQWRVAVLGVFVLAAVITPSGDPVSLMALALPMLVLFFVAVAVGHLATRSRRRAARVGATRDGS
jgi:sec-independent protein translocase protein TatC